MKWQKIRSNKAYTLIEILVAITIIGIIVGVGYISFRDFSRRQALVTVARALEGDVKLAQEKALAGTKTEDCVGVLDGYGLNIHSSTVYSIDQICSGGSTAIKTVDLSTQGISSIVATYSGGSSGVPNPIIYKSLGQGTNILGPYNPSSLTVVITLTQTGTGNTTVVYLGVAGVIRR